MTPSEGSAPTASRSARLSAYLAHDPNNLQLLADAAIAAMDEGASASASLLLQRYAALSELPPTLRNLEGLIAIGDQRFVDAIAVLSSLLAEGHADTAVRFNLAWSKAILNDHQ